MTAEELARLLLVSTRLLAYVGLFGVVGAYAFRVAIGDRLRRDRALPASALDEVERRTARIGLVGALVLLVATLGRLYAQTYSIFGLDEVVTGSHLRLVALDTRWGHGWVVQLAVVLIAAVGCGMAPANRRGWRLAGLAGLGLAATLPLTGHAMAVGTGWVSVPVALQTVHTLGGAAWLGTLAVLTLVGLRAGDPATAEAMVRMFSPLALVGAGGLAVTGTVTAALYLGGFGALWGTTYGLALAAKLILFGATASFGAYNWRRVRRRVGTPEGLRQLRHSVRAELTTALAVLVATAILVGLPLPHD